MNFIFKKCNFIRMFICLILTPIFLFNGTELTSFAYRFKFLDYNNLGWPGLRLEDDLDENLLYTRRYKLGGSYQDIYNERENFVLRHNNESENYELHKLISDELLDDFATYLESLDEYTYEDINFLLDRSMDWVPSVILMSSDEKYFNMYYSTHSNKLNSSNDTMDDLKLLVEYGNFFSLLEREISKIERLFPNRYTQAITEAREYINKLDFRFDKGILTFKHPYYDDRLFTYITRPFIID